ncbi:MAG TPA: SRPBCC family protein [Ktedonobacteraceae bacterium]
MEIERRLVINLSAEEIFDYMADVDSWVEWSGTVITVRKTTPGAISAGATLRCTLRFLGRWLETTYELVEFEPGHLFTLKSISSLAPSIFTYRLEQAEPGKTNVSVEALIELIEGYMGLDEAVVVSAVCRQLECDLYTIRDILEARNSLTGSRTFGGCGD